VDGVKLRHKEKVVKDSMEVTNLQSKEGGGDRGNTWKRDFG